MNILSKAIKGKIKEKLEGLVNTQVLGEVQVDDLRKGVLDRDYAYYPAALLTTPSIEGGYFTNRENERTHTYEIVIVQKASNVTEIDEIEELAETILDEFDKDPTLGGAANAGLEPATTSPEAVTSRSETYIVFGVTLRAKAIKNVID